MAVSRRARALKLPFEEGLPPGAPSGLSYHPDVLSLAEESELVARLEALPFQEVRMHGVAGRRTVVHFGWDYGYDSWKIQPTHPIPDFLQPVRSRVALLAGLPAEALAQALIARYPAGAGIGWHRDAPMFGPTVAGVSLLSESVMRLRPPRPRPPPAFPSPAGAALGIRADRRRPRAVAAQHPTRRESSLLDFVPHAGERRRSLTGAEN